MHTRNRYLGVFVTHLPEVLLLLLLIAAIFLVFRYSPSFLSITAQTAAIATLLTIVGVTANNLAQAVSQERREIYKATRDIRQAIYTELSESVAKRVIHLAKYLRVDLPDAEMFSSDHSITSAIYKVHLYGGQETIKRLVDLNVLFLELEISYWRERQKVMLLINRIKQLDYAINQATEKLNQINTYLQTITPGFLGLSAAQQQQIQNLQTQFVQVQQQNTQFQTARGKDSEQVQTEMKVFQTLFAESYLKINPTLRLLLVAVREELDISLNIDQYMEILSTSDSKIHEMVRASINSS